jgi:hypothetical protein
MQDHRHRRAMELEIAAQVGASRLWVVARDAPDLEQPSARALGALELARVRGRTPVDVVGPGRRRRMQRTADPTAVASPPRTTTSQGWALRVEGACAAAASTSRSTASGTGRSR